MSEFIAIDGPAGSGKSSVSKEVARRRGYGYLDTGSAYRALTWYILERGVDPEDADAVLAAVSEVDLRLSIDVDDRSVRVGGMGLVGPVDVTTAIREPRVSAAVSAVARPGGVRTEVNALFRYLVESAPYPAVVVEGRDITTVVAADAPVRILLTAHPDVRAARRATELGEDAAVVAAAVRERDALDSQVNDFLNAAEGVEVVDSTELDFEQTVDAVLSVIERKRGSFDG